MIKAYNLKPFNVIKLPTGIYQVILAIEPQMSLGGDNDTIKFYVLEYSSTMVARQHTKFICELNDEFEVYAEASITW